MLTLSALILLTIKASQVTPVISALLGGGILGFVVQVIKAGAERDSIAATASATAIEVFQASIAQLRSDLESAHQEAEGLARELAKARREMSSVTAERGHLQDEVTTLRQQVAALEIQITDLRKRPHYDRRTPPSS